MEPALRELRERGDIIGSMHKALKHDGPRGITVNLVNPGSIDTDMTPADGPQAYPVWVGIGVAGVTAYGTLFLGEP